MRTCAGLFMCAAMLAACDEKPSASAEAPPPPTVGVITIAERDVTASQSYIGRLQAVDDVQLLARVQGVIEEIHFTDGQDVKQGDLLFTLESGTYKADVDLNQAKVASAQAAYDQAKTQFDRSTTLFSKGDVTSSRVDQDKASMQQAAAALQVAKAELRQAQIQLGYTAIIAPISGRIGIAAYSRGALVDASSGPLVEITSLDPIQATFGVSETVMVKVKEARLKQGLDAGFNAANGVDTGLVPVIVLPDGTRYDQKGVVDYVGTNVDTKTGTITVRATFPNPDRLLSPGQFVTINLEDQAPRRVLTVPQAAVQEDRDGTYVLVVDQNGKVGQKHFTVLATDGTDYVVDKGLIAGDIVITEGIQKVRQGVPVKTVPAGSSPGS